MHPEQVGFSSERLQRVSTMLRGYVERGELPCASAVVARNGVTAYREKFGWQDIEAAKPVEFDTIFRIMSMTKPVTAVAAMLLYEEGHFDLNTPIHQFLSAFKDMRVVIRQRDDGTVETERAATPLTFRHLFTHTSGISYGFMPDDLVDGMIQDVIKALNEEDAPVTIQRFVECLAGVPLAFQPGSRWRYGLSLDVLGALVEVISGMSLGDFFQQRIFEPLGMVDTGFTVPEEKLVRLAMVCRRDPQTGALVRHESPVPLAVGLWGGAGLVSTLDDYARFAGMLANRGEFNGTRLLSPTTVAMFSTNYAAQEALPSFHAEDPRINGGYGYSLGTAVLLDPAATGKFGNVGEFTWGGAFSTYFWVDPQETLSAVLMTQFDPVWAYPTPWQFKQLVYQALVG